MAGPWEQYASASPAQPETGPWSKYGSAQEKEQPSAITRFADQVGPIGLIHALFTPSNDPNEHPLATFGKNAVNTLKGIGDNTTAAKVAKDISAGNYGQALRHVFVGSAGPAGEIIDHAIDRFNEGDMAGGMGALVNIPLLIAGPKVPEAATATKAAIPAAIKAGAGDVAAGAAKIGGGALADAAGVPGHLGAIVGGVGAPGHIGGIAQIGRGLWNGIKEGIAAGKEALTPEPEPPPSPYFAGGSTGRSAPIAAAPIENAPPISSSPSSVGQYSAESPLNTSAVPIRTTGTVQPRAPLQPTFKGRPVMLQEDGKPLMYTDDAESAATKAPIISHAESIKPSVAKTLAEGTERKMPDGSIQVLQRVPIDDLHPTEGNELYPDVVRSYQTSGYAVQPELEVRPEGGFSVKEGHHRITADVRNGAKDVLAWTPKDAAAATAESPVNTSGVKVIPFSKQDLPASAYEGPARAAKVQKLATYLHEAGASANDVAQLEASDPFWEKAAKGAGINPPSRASVAQTIFQLRKLEQAAKPAAANISEELANRLDQTGARAIAEKLAKAMQ